MKKILTLFPALTLATYVFSQNDTMELVRDSVTVTSLSYGHEAPPPPKARIYHLNPVVDVPVTAAATGWTLFAFTKIYSKDTSTRAQILALSPKNVASINRSSTHRYSPKAFDVSNMFFYGSMPYPLVLLADKHMRKDIAKIGFLWLEAMSITGALYTGSVYFHDKYRPYAYNPDVDINRRVRGGAKNSFFAGHVGLVGTSTFFTARTFADYHPESSLRYVLYGVAIVATGSTAYLRYKAGEHFLTDVLVGAGVGTLSGLLVPHFHKTKNFSQNRISLSPYITGESNGVAMTYHF